MIRIIVPALALAVLAVACGGETTLASVCSEASECGHAQAECRTESGSNVGQCSSSCLDDDFCEEVFGAGVCQVRCILPCSTDEECPTATACRAGVCTATCSGDADCSEGHMCAERFCVDN